MYCGLCSPSTQPERLSHTQSQRVGCNKLGYVNHSCATLLYPTARPMSTEVALVITYILPQGRKGRREEQKNGFNSALSASLRGEKARRTVSSAFVGNHQKLRRRVPVTFLHPPGSGQSSNHAQCRTTGRSVGQPRAVALQPSEFRPVQLLSPGRRLRPIEVGFLRQLQSARSGLTRLFIRGDQTRGIRALHPIGSHLWGSAAGGRPAPTCPSLHRQPVSGQAETWREAP